MGRRKRLTRRKRALVWCLALALVVGLGGLQYRYLSYWKPIREAENEGGVGKTAWLMDVPLERGLDKARRMLRGNEQALMAVTIYPRSFPNGWGVEHQAYLDCTPPTAFHAAVQNLGIFRNDEDEMGLDMELFGRVEDPAGDRVRLELYWRPEMPDKLGEPQILETVEVPKLDWVKREGMTCFEQQFVISYPEDGGEMRARLTLLDWEGEELETQEYPMKWHFIGGSEYF